MTPSWCIVIHVPMVRAILTALVLVFVVSGGARARAKTESPQVRDLFQRASTKYKLGQFSEALVDFEAALKLEQRPSIIFNIAQCLRQLKQYSKSLFYYRLFLSDWERTQGSKPTNFEEIQEYIAQLTAQIEKQQRQQRGPPARGEPVRATKSTATLHFEGLPDGAVVLVGGVVRAQAPLRSPLELSPGFHDVRIQAGGFAPWRRTLSVLAGKVYKQEVLLAPATRSRFWFIAGIASGAAAAGALAVGIVFNVKTNSSDDPDAYDSYRGASTAGYVLGGVFAATAITSLVLHYVKGAKRGDPAAAALLAPTPGGAMAAGVVRF